MRGKTHRLREDADRLVEISRFSVFLYKGLTDNQRWLLYYNLKEAADEIDSLRSRLGAISEIASEEPEE